MKPRKITDEGYQTIQSGKHFCPFNADWGGVKVGSLYQVYSPSHKTPITVKATQDCPIALRAVN